jgi:hypothetical protein
VSWRQVGLLTRTASGHTAEMLRDESGGYGFTVYEKTAEGPKMLTPRPVGPFKTTREAIDAAEAWQP